MLPDLLSLGAGLWVGVATMIVVGLAIRTVIGIARGELRQIAG